jgi:hypothetical protein
MATKLDKDLTRETSVVVNEREVILTLTADQNINMKLKGMKSGHVSIPIKDVYDQLTGGGSQPEAEVEGVPAKLKAGKESDMVSLQDLRSRFNVTGLPYESIVQVDMIIVEMLKEKNIKKR